MKNFPIDYFAIVVVGFLIGFGSMFVVRPMNASPSIPTFSDIENKMVDGRQEEVKADREVDKINVAASREWMENPEPFVAELEYLMETNCSDHAMRQYGQMLARLDTSLFHPDTGRLRDADGKTIPRIGMNLLLNSIPAFLPLPYLKDEHVPGNFKRIMQHIPRKSDWTTCTFNISPMWRIPRNPI
ncbi:hypothetical protein [Labrenzia sp. PHM005]|uniref:hypothetical protein n=1 Tax=Labrenzia sp. PHM005 TaxID=2590016 RepID=UPI00114055AF|nr:hypothetical protein [Labrenzia sp. PHM005]QDG76970.1 hypothetical protein FJ695_14390 [Labrenzia sp. PHM005]